MRETVREIDEPSPALAGPGLAAAVRRAFLATRPPFFVASIMPVLIGSLWAAMAHGRFDALLFALALACTVLAHAAANVYNDVGDDIIGADPGNTERIYPFTGGSRFIQSGLLSRKQMLHLACGLGAAALALGTLLAVLRGPGVILLGLVGLGLGWLYSFPGAQLSARGVGEAAVALGFGALPLLGSVWLQTGHIDSAALLLWVPVGAWVAAILVINEVPDIEADRRANKRTLVVRFGTHGARRIYLALTLIALAASAAAMASHTLPLWYALPALGLAALGFKAARAISPGNPLRSRLRHAIQLTLAIHGLGCLAILLAIWLSFGRAS